jgi:hypothetical protein
MIALLARSRSSHWLRKEASIVGHSSAVGRRRDQVASGRIHGRGAGLADDRFRVPAAALQWCGPSTIANALFKGGMLYTAHRQFRRSPRRTLAEFFAYENISHGRRPLFRQASNPKAPHLWVARQQADSPLPACVREPKRCSQVWQVNPLPIWQ